MIRVIVAGDRRWECSGLATRVLDRLRKRYGAENLVIVHGNDSAGVDVAFEQIAPLMIIKRERHEADELRHGDDAEAIRNQEMVDAGAKFAICCHKSISWSRGTKDLARRAMAAGIPVWLIDSEDAEPRRIKAADLRPAPAAK